MHTLCLSSANELYSWGVNDEAALGRPAGGEPWSKSSHQGEMQESDVPCAVSMPKGTGTMTALSAGDSHSAVLTATGQVYVWGTFRDDAGVMGFSASCRFAVCPFPCRNVPLSDVFVPVSALPGAALPLVGSLPAHCAPLCSAMTCRLAVAWPLCRVLLLCVFPLHYGPSGSPRHRAARRRRFAQLCLVCS